MRRVEGSEEELEERAVPFGALYEHWERTRWSLGSLTYDVDRASFEALDETARERMRWLFTHRFDGEATVARLMTPFHERCAQVNIEKMEDFASRKEDVAPETASLLTPPHGQVISTVRTNGEPAEDRIAVQTAP